MRFPFLQTLRHHAVVYIASHVDTDLCQRLESLPEPCLRAILCDRALAENLFLLLYSCNAFANLSHLLLWHD